MDSEQWKYKFILRVRDAGRRGLTRTELSNAWGWFRYAHNRKIADGWIKELVRAGEVTVERRTPGTGGPSTIVYRVRR